jgi:hypothetical protein
LNRLGYRLRPVRKSKSQKKFRETDAIFIAPMIFLIAPMDNSLQGELSVAANAFNVVLDTVMVNAWR